MFPESYHFIFFVFDSAQEVAEVLGARHGRQAPSNSSNKSNNSHLDMSDHLEKRFKSRKNPSNFGAGECVLGRKKNLLFNLPPPSCLRFKITVGPYGSKTYLYQVGLQRLSVDPIHFTLSQQLLWVIFVCVCGMVW